MEGSIPRRSLRYKSAVRRFVSAIRGRSEVSSDPAGRVCSREWSERSRVSRDATRAKISSESFDSLLNCFKNLAKVDKYERKGASYNLRVGSKARNFPY